MVYNDTDSNYNIVINDNFTAQKSCKLTMVEDKEYFYNGTTYNKTKHTEKESNFSDSTDSFSDFNSEFSYDNNLETQFKPNENYISNSIINIDIISVKSDIYIENKYSNMTSNDLIPSQYCYDTNIINEKTEQPIKEESTKKSKEEIINNITNIINDKVIGKNYEIKGEDFTIIIKPTNSTSFPNSTHVDFEECELLLRNHYNISNSSIITFFQIEVNNNDKTALYNQIKYFTYDDKKQELDLSLCEDIDTQIHYSIKENSSLDISTISDFKNLGVDIFNIKDDFFTDLCYSFSDSDNDMILEDRIKYIYQNYSLCEEGCTYNDIKFKEI